MNYLLNVRFRSIDPQTPVWEIAHVLKGHSMWETAKVDGLVQGFWLRS